MGAVMCAEISGDGMQWEAILKGRAGREVEIGSDGIARDVEADKGGTQEPEILARASFASQYIGAPDRAVVEAIRHHSKGVMQQRARRALRELASKPGRPHRLLIDFGAGFGWQWADLAIEFSSVRFLLVDLVLENLFVCRSLMPFARYPNVMCLHADVADLPIMDAVGDYGWSVQVFQHLPPDKRRASINELRRVLGSDAGLYLVWLRSVPLVERIYALCGRPYHVRGWMTSGTYLERYDEGIEKELGRVFPVCQVTYSETLFHPDLFFAPSSRLLVDLDLWLSSTRVARLLARQVEIRGAASSEARDLRTG